MTLLSRIVSRSPQIATPGVCAFGEAQLRFAPLDQLDERTGVVGGVLVGMRIECV